MSRNPEQKGARRLTIDEQILAQENLLVEAEKILNGAIADGHEEDIRKSAEFRATLLSTLDYLRKVKDAGSATDLAEIFEHESSRVPPEPLTKLVAMLRAEIARLEHAPATAQNRMWRSKLEAQLHTQESEIERIVNLSYGGSH